MHRIEMRRPRSMAKLFCRRRARGGRKNAQRFGKWGASDAVFREDGSDVFVWRDVERRVSGANIWRDSDSLDLRDFIGRAFFDRDVVARGNRKVEGGNGCGDIERDVMLFGKDSNLIRANFVGSVSISCNPICTRNDSAKLSGLQEVAHHIVCDERERNIAAIEFPGGEARTLKIWARFGNVDVELLAL